MPDSSAWSYLFLPEDSSDAEPLQPPPAAARIGKILLWTAVAVLLGVLLGHPT
ncbi:polyprenol-monophosphomannose synthase, Ppm1A [Pseudodesulfovibrio mercurii]|uniref:Polyprenol-monophosphomannose synthase, Ppm1A n=1 Tax=Pseudodesulfovibrio mercurii TaxID=641491 RepID=F0JIR2_9BACT|nr:hypothetical protein [Pseudodesulfovibrio mercurii]EGB15496.1 polyprenol-monophosphomannose synthase, Ppm1A [Pseudodesulfovibrio mercurii]